MFAGMGELESRKNIKSDRSYSQKGCFKERCIDKMFPHRITMRPRKGSRQTNHGFSYSLILMLSSDSFVLPLPSRPPYCMHSAMEEQETSRPAQDIPSSREQPISTSRSLTNHESYPSDQSGIGHLESSINEISNPQFSLLIVFCLLPAVTRKGILCNVVQNPLIEPEFIPFTRELNDNKHI